jgi:glycosyltransferase involved in cell wall biosynthesis
MQASPLVSVIVPTYNRGYILPQAINSIVKQTYTNWELLIIDDGSTDNTKEVVAKNRDSRIHYFIKENGGPCAARNYGLGRSQGIWVTYLDSDDILLKDCLKVMVERVSSVPSTVFALPRGIRMLDLFENGTLVSSVDDSEDMPNTFTVKDIFMRNARFACLGMFHLKRLYT